MNQAELHRRFIAAARRHPPSQAVPHTFERRILARLRACPRADHWAWWSQALWRAVAPCAAIMVLLGAWWWFTPAGAPPANDLSQDLENTVLAAAESEPSPELSR
jgi:hypothetical protein